jgi:pentatricopeptide repeat protein
MLSSKKPAVVTYTGLIRACEKAGHWNGAIAIFRQMQYVCTPNVGTCNIMISLYGRHRMFEDALEIFEGVKKGRLARKKMYEEGTCSLTPDQFTYESMLGACTVCEQWVYFHEVFQEMVRNGFGLHCQRHSWMIAPLLKAGQVCCSASYADLCIIMHVCSPLNCSLFFLSGVKDSTIRLFGVVDHVVLSGLNCLSQMHIVKRMLGCLKNTDGTPNVNVYRVLLASCCTLGQHGEVVSYLKDLLQQGVAVSSEEWATIFRAALEKLPVADVESFMSTLTKSDNTYGDMVLKDILNTHSSCEGQFSMNTA